MKKYLLALLLVMLYSFTLWSQQITWSETYNFEKNIVFLKELDGVLYAGIEDAGIYKLSAANTWQKCNSEDKIFYPSDMILVENSLFVATGYDGLLKTELNTSNCIWHKFGNDFKFNTIYSLTFNADKWTVSTDKGLYMSSNNGESWEKANFPVTDVNVTHIFYTYHEGNNLYAATQGYIFHSEDNGNTWVADSLSTSYDMRKISKINDNLYAFSMGGGVYIREGVNWTPTFLTQKELNGGNVSEVILANTHTIYLAERGISKDSIFINNGLANPSSVTSLISFNNYLYAGDSNGKLWKTAVPAFKESEINQKSEKNKELITLSVRPSIATDYVEAVFSVPPKSNFSLHLLNSVGGIIESQNSSNLASGANSFIFETTNLPAGNYFVVLQSANQSLTQKFIVLP